MMSEGKKIKVLFINGMHATEKEFSDQVSIIKKYADVEAPFLKYEFTNTDIGKCEELIDTKGINFLMGYSMGGALAYYLSNKYKIPSLIFNPAFREEDSLGGMMPLKLYDVFPDQFMVTGAKDDVVPPNIQLGTFLGKRKSVEPEIGHDIPNDMFDLYCSIIIDSPISVQQIHDLADSKNIKWDDDDKFLQFTQAVTGKKYLDDLTDKERKILYDELEKRGSDPIGIDLSDHKINIPSELTGKNIFYNSKIFITGTDYILGGFTAEEINSVAVVGDTTAVNVPKLKFLAEERLEAAIEKFKYECCKNILKQDPLRSEADLNKDILNNINNLLETYLQTRIDTIDTEEIKDLIINHSAYQTWLNRIENRIADFKRSFMYVPETINYTGPLEDGKTAIDIESAEECTKSATFEEMMEALLGITEKNEA